jgi:hypothetical protein
MFSPRASNRIALALTAFGVNRYDRLLELLILLYSGSTQRLAAYEIGIG